MPGRPVISNCGTTTEKISEYLHHNLKPTMQESWSLIYSGHSGNFMKKVKHLGQIPIFQFQIGYGMCNRPLSRYTSQGWLRNTKKVTK